MKKPLTLLAGVGIAGALLVGCTSHESTCAPRAMVELRNVEFPLPLKPGGGSGGGGGRSSSSSKGGSYGGTKPGSSPGGVSAPRPPRAPTAGYKPRPGQSAPPTYVRQSDGSWLPFIGGVIVGDALSHAPEGC